MIRPIRHRIVVRDLPEPTRKGSVHLIEPDKNVPMKATVVSVGQGQLCDNGVTVPSVLKPGDTVLFHRQYGTVIDGLRVLSEYDILCVEE